MAKASDLRGTKRRFEIQDISNLGIQAYGDNNLYPQDARRALNASDSGTACLDRLEMFLVGNGFEDEVFSAMNANMYGDTMDDILQYVAKDLACYNGFAIHANYNVMGELISISHIPFEHTRLTELDEIGGISKIAVFPDWEGIRKFGGKRLRPTPETVDYLDIFNPEPEVVMAQIEYAGGIDNYKGQILWVSSAGRNVYPLAKFDSVFGYLGAENELSTLTLRTIRDGVFSTGILAVRKGNTEDPINDIADKLDELVGAENAMSIIVTQFEQEQDIPKLIPLESENYAEKFKTTSEEATIRIYRCFGQEMFYRINVGSVGFSNDIMSEAFRLYNSLTSNDRRIIERAFDLIVSNWVENISENKTAIKPLEYTRSEDIQGQTYTFNVGK